MSNKKNGDPRLSDTREPADLSVEELQDSIRFALLQAQGCLLEYLVVCIKTDRQFTPERAREYYEILCSLKSLPVE